MECTDPMTPHAPRVSLVTGGAGFIGSHFVELLFDRRPDARIIVLDALTYAANPGNIPPRIRESDRFKFVQGNICNTLLVGSLMAEVDEVIHFAAESHVTRSIVDDTPFFETDVMGTQSIAAAISRNKIKKFVHISTSEVYGTAAYAPMDELHPLNPCTPYAAAKAGADRLVYAYRETYGIPTVIIRPFNNYGPRQHLEKVVPRFITSALLDEPLTIHGDGLMSRDWIFVEDTCEAILKTLESDRAVGEVLNLGTGIDTSVLDIAEKILGAAGSSSTIVHIDRRPGQVDRHIATARKAETLLGWHPRVTLAEGLARTVRWYRDNRAWWLPQRSGAAVSVTDAGRGLAGAF